MLRSIRRPLCRGGAPMNDFYPGEREKSDLGQYLRGGVPWAN